MINVQQPQPPQQANMNINKNVEQKEEDPFARLGKRQQSVYNPQIAAFEQKQALERVQQFATQNPYSPAAMLPQSVQRTHVRGSSQHRRAETHAFGLKNLSKINSFQKKPHRRNMSVCHCFLFFYIFSILFIMM